MGSVEQMPFTYQSYAGMIRALRKKNFAFVNYSNYQDQKDKAVILRHDVDFDPARCYRIAEIEYLEKASSTFFSCCDRTSTMFYLPRCCLWLKNSREWDTL